MARNTLNLWVKLTKLGVLAWGSVNEKHGAALPPDTDLRLAVHLARKISEREGAVFLGAIATSCEYPEIKTGEHKAPEAVLKDLRDFLLRGKQLGINTVAIVSGHGGNNLLKPKISSLEKELGMRLIFCDSLLALEGPHAWSGEVSAGLWLGFANQAELSKQKDFSRFPEVGFVGLREARRKYHWVERMAREVESEELRASKLLGRVIIECTIRDAIQRIEEAKSGQAPTA